MDEEALSRILDRAVDRAVDRVLEKLQERPSPAKLKGELGLVTREEFALAVGRTVRSLKRDWVMRVGPKPVHLGQQVFYKISDIKASLEDKYRAEGDPNDKPRTRRRRIP